jgi:uncharacterized protein YecT (DUF1311 family)
MREYDRLDIDYKITCLKDEFAVVDNIIDFNCKVMVVEAKFVDRYEKHRNALNKLIGSQRAWVKYRDADVMFSQNSESYYLDGEYKDSEDQDYISSKNNVEIERLIVSIMIIYQRENVLYHYLKGGGGFNYVYSLSVGWFI